MFCRVNNLSTPFKLSLQIRPCHCCINMVMTWVNQAIRKEAFLCCMKFLLGANPSPDPMLTFVKLNSKEQNFSNIWIKIKMFSLKIFVLNVVYKSHFAEASYSNTLILGTSECDFRNAIFNLVLLIGSYNDDALKRPPVRLMAWCC